jgi:hypothetical protein
MLSRRPIQFVPGEQNVGIKSTTEAVSFVSAVVARLTFISYKRLWILINDYSSRFDKSGTPFLRIKLLRRTLREKPLLARSVREINVPGAQTMYKKANHIDRASIISVLATLVMVCPSLERFTGLHIPFDHEFDRLTHALASRENLRERVWLLKGIEEGYDSIGAYRTNARPVKFDGSVANGDVFLDSHSRWSRLETLVLFGQESGNLDYRAFVGTFRSLAGLKNLLICGFNTIQFNDRTMAALPRRLHSLRLQDLPGVTERGLLRLKDNSNETMRSLSLVNLEIKSARLIAHYFAQMQRLRKFVLVQSTSPLWPADAKDSTPNTPATQRFSVPGSGMYASSSLEFLHWDISPFFHPSLSHLASSIQAGAFPKLRAIRAPCDDGTLQALCRPRASIARPADIDAAKAAASLGLRSTSLAAARVEAQKRLEATKEAPLMHILVTDDKGKLITRYNVKRFLGTVSSRIDYVLDGDGERPEFRLSEMGANVYCKAASVASGAISFVPPSLRNITFGEGGGVGAASGALLEADALLMSGPSGPPNVPSKNGAVGDDGTGGVRTRMISRPGTSAGGNGANGGAVMLGATGQRTCSGVVDSPSLSFGQAVSAMVSRDGSRAQAQQVAGNTRAHVPRERVRMLRAEMFF